MTNKELLQRFTEISETNLFPIQFGDGTVLMGYPPNDIYQLGVAATFNECHHAVREFVDQQIAQKVVQGSQLAKTQAALRQLYNAVRRSESTNDRLGMIEAMDEAGRWF